jgi:Cof subfamily protein (haloacid dehalogenase superfamily)
MSEARLAVFDIDGTLVTMEKTILPSTLSAIRTLQANGVNVAIATGRNYKMAQSVIDATGIHDYVVCNGSAYFVDDQLVAQRAMDRGDMLKLNEYTRAIGGNFIAETADEIYVDDDQDELARTIIAGCDTVALPGAGYAAAHPIVQAIALMTEAQEAAAPALAHTQFRRFGPDGVDVLPDDGSKARAIAQLAEHLGVAHANIVAFGDNQNDKEMLQAAGIGIAMGHATPDVQATANWVTADSESDGIYKGLQHIGWL